MPSFTVDRKQINLFHIDGQYLFKHYFEQEPVFAELREYYNEDEYRFEVPKDALNEVQEVLRDHFFDPVVIDDPEPFGVIFPKYKDHPDMLFKASVLQESQRDHNIFLMKDQLSVEQALNMDATRLEDTDLKFRM